MASVMRFDEWQDSNGNAVASAANGVGAFNASTTITATDASWAVPTLASPIVKVIAIGGGGGGGASANDGSAQNGGTGGTTTFNAGVAGTVTATGGSGGLHSWQNINGQTQTLGFASGNGGQGAIRSNNSLTGGNGNGGSITVAYLDLTGISTVNVSIGAGGTGGNGNQEDGAPGGRGEVIVEYVAG